MKFYWLIALAALCGSSVRAQTNTAVVKPPPRAPTLIASERGEFDLNKHKAIYEGHVRVDSPEMKLTCDWLVADLPPAGGRPDHIVCETNVVINFTDERGQTNHVTSDKAVYDYHVQEGVTNETVTFTGHPVIENPQSTIHSEPIVWDRAKNHFNFTNPKMIFRQNLDVGPAKTNPVPAKTNAVSRPK
jgi:lipopolysaccharide export system protein LptA